MSDKTGVESIAIIGMTARFPGARNTSEYWKNLCQGVESVTFYSAEELIAVGADPALIALPNYVRAAHALEDFDRFDAPFFNVSPREAEILDPEHRLFLECAWEALEDAGYDPATYPGLIGVFGGAGGYSRFFMGTLPTFSQLVSSIGKLPVAIAGHANYLATRVSYKLNLKGPSLTVQTACSTSLVATHVACQNLLTYQCDMALAGGVSITAGQRYGYLYQEGSIESPDGHCRPFDAKAQGTVFGDGAGMVVLKRLSDALADGDHIYALIQGSAINNDGSLKVGFTAPGAEGQMEVVSMALAAADVTPETISYIEAHGTGTAMGDPIEVDALTQAFQAYTDKKRFCAIGSVKSNLGHTDAAAGVAGLIKTALALEHKMLPPSINYEAPNPQIDFVNSPFYVNTELREWKTDGQPRRAGVSSFGMGGTNAHAILEEAPKVEPSSESRRYQLLVLSAHTEQSLEKMMDNLADHLRASPDLELANVAYTLQVGRRAFEKRRAVICETTLDHAIAALQERDPTWVSTNVQPETKRAVVFMFSGQGTQHVHMGRDLYQREPLFREQVDVCAELLRSYLELDLRNVLYPADTDTEEAARRLDQTEIAQPALFAIEYALARLWMSWGVKPQAMIGHSIGEYVAACLAGVFSLRDALALVAVRGQLMQSMPPGAMLAVPLAEADVQPLLADSLAIATVNGPERCVVAGPTEAVVALERRLTDKNIAARRLHTSHAFHSPMMDPILEPFKERVSQVQLHTPQIRYISNVTGTWIEPEEATSPAYWARHLRQAVRLSAGISALAQTPDQVLLEVGPGHTLHALAQRHPDRAPAQVILSSMRDPSDTQDDDAVLLHALGQIWLAGVPVDWSGFYAHEQRRRCSLPTYPFERQRYWIDSLLESRSALDERSKGESATAKKGDIADWFYVPTWKRMALVGLERMEPKDRSWLFFVDECGLGMTLVERLQQRGEDVTAVMAGESFRRVRDEVYTINPQTGADYAALVKHLYTVNRPPNRIVHMWSVTSENGNSTEEIVGRTQQLGFYSLIFLAQALGSQQDLKPLHIWVVSNAMQDVLGDEPICPGKATLLGPCKVIPKEYEQMTCSSVDVVLPTRQLDTPAEQLMTELLTDARDELVAYRGRSRWVQSYEPIRLEDTESGIARLNEKGVYLITGGLGGLGSALAERLARAVQARLVLVGRSALPSRADWPAWLSDDTQDERVRRRIQQVLALEKLGAEVLVATADVTNREQMQQVLDEAHEQFGPVNGVFHAAGVPGEGLIQLKTPDVAAQVLMPKLQGTLTLDTALRDEPLDFLVLYSSSIAVTGGLGQVDYCAANAFLDAFAHYNHYRRSVPTVSINWGPWQWDAWQETSLSSQPQVYEQAKYVREAYGITFTEGDEALWRILATSLPQVLVLTQDFQAFVDQSSSLTSASLLETIQAMWKDRQTYPRPNLRTAYVPPRNEAEGKIAEIWAECLAVDKVGIHDQFFELGGDSLLGILIVSRLEKELGVKLSAADLYEGPTVSTLYSMIYPEQEESALTLEESRGKMRKELRRRQRRNIAADGGN
jgi:acyl transferase domain-containing protein/acyl carrier protein